MTGRDLTTTREQVFGDVDPGTECRICGRPVDDGRSKTCSDYCDNLLSAVMGMLNWSSVRRQIINRDDETCQECGLDYSQIRRARDHIRDRIETRVPDRLENPRIDDVEAVEEYDWEAHRKWHEKLRLPSGEEDATVADPAPYRVLGIEPDASGSEIRKAFRERAKETHADAGGSSEAFKRVKRAKEELLE